MKSKNIYLMEVVYAVFFIITAVSLVYFVVTLKDNPYYTFNYLKSQLYYFSYEISHPAYTVYSRQLDDTSQTIPVLVYHGIVEKSDGVNITRENFLKQMVALKKAGYQTVTIEEFGAYVRGEKKPQANVFLLTFDDGRADSYYSADPVLKLVGYNAVMFVITGQSLAEKNAKSTFYLGVKELEQMIKTGRWELQSHGREAHTFYPVNEFGQTGHFYTNKLWVPEKQRLETSEEFRQRVEDDFLSSKTELEQRFDIKINSLAFPFGEFGEYSLNYSDAKKEVTKAVEKVYDFTFFQYWPRVNDSYLANYYDDLKSSKFVKRISVSASWSEEELKNVVEASRAKQIPYKEDYYNKKNWITVSGDTYVDTTSAALVVTTKKSLAISYLDGSYLWNSYEFSARFAGQSNEATISLMTYFENTLNYTECIFNSGSLFIRKNKGGIYETLGQRMNVDIFNGGVFSIKTDKESVSCSLDGEVLLEAANSGSSARHGGVGIKIWNPKIQEERVIVDKISVKK